MLCVFVIVYHFSLKRLVRTDTRHKNLVTALNKKHGSSELLNFKNSICKEKFGTFTK